MMSYVCASSINFLEMLAAINLCPGSSLKYDVQHTDFRIILEKNLYSQNVLFACIINSGIQMSNKCEIKRFSVFGTNKIFHEEMPDVYDMILTTMAQYQGISFV